MQLVRVQRSLRETRLNILTDKPEAAEVCWAEAVKQRIRLEAYVRADSRFAWSLDPVDVKPWAPEVVKRMASAASLAGVGPMAAVAGVIADMTFERGFGSCPTVLVVENGGEVVASTLTEPVILGIYVRAQEVKGFTLRLKPEDTPLGIASSSSTLGAGVTLGEADMVTVFAENAGLADAVATAVCNMVAGGNARKSIEAGLAKALTVEGVKGCIIVYRGLIGFRGWIPEIERRA